MNRIIKHNKKIIHQDIDGEVLWRGLKLELVERRRRKQSRSWGRRWRLLLTFSSDNNCNETSLLNLRKLRWNIAEPIDVDAYPFIPLLRWPRLQYRKLFFIGKHHLLIKLTQLRITENFWVGQQWLLCLIARGVIILRFETIQANSRLCQNFCFFSLL